MTYVDDVALMITPHDPATLQQAIRATARVAIDTLATFGVRTNMKPGKTEAMPIFHGSGARKARSMFIQGGRCITVPTRAFGDQTLLLVDEYKHLGGVTHAKASMTKEIARRGGARRDFFPPATITHPEGTPPILN